MFVKNVYININFLLHNLIKSQLYKYIIKLLAILILLIKIIIFEITNNRAKKIIIKSSF